VRGERTEETRTSSDSPVCCGRIHSSQLPSLRAAWACLACWEQTLWHQPKPRTFDLVHHHRPRGPLAWPDSSGVVPQCRWQARASLGSIARAPSRELLLQAPTMQAFEADEADEAELGTWNLEFSL
jgi:hypothetical protein